MKEIKGYTVHLMYDDYVDVEADSSKAAIAEAKQTIWPGDLDAEIESEYEAELKPGRGNSALSGS